MSRTKKAVLLLFVAAVYCRKGDPLQVHTLAPEGRETNHFPLPLTKQSFKAREMAYLKNPAASAGV